MDYDRTFDFGGRSFRYWRSGSGTPLLLLHGAGGSAMWEAEAERLSATHDVILPQHPGFDGSRYPEWMETVEDLAYLYSAAMQDWGLTRFRLMGHSLGGWIAGEMAIRIPAAIDRLILVAAGGIRGQGYAGNNFIWSAEETAAALFVDPAMRAKFVEPPADEAIALRVHRSRESTARLVWSPRWIGPAMNKWAARIAMPTLVIWGEADGLFPASFGRTFADRLPDSTFVEIANCGHVPHLERPEPFRAAIDPFLESAS